MQSDHPKPSVSSSSHGSTSVSSVPDASWMNIVVAVCMLHYALCSNCVTLISEVHQLLLIYALSMHGRMLSAHTEQHSMGTFDDRIRCFCSVCTYVLER